MENRTRGQARMAYTFDKRKLNQRNNSSSTRKKSLQETQLPNSLMRRIMEDPRAEQEADRLLQSVPTKSINRKNTAGIM